MTTNFKGFHCRYIWEDLGKLVPIRPVYKSQIVPYISAMNSAQQNLQNEWLPNPIYKQGGFYKFLVLKSPISNARPLQLNSFQEIAINHTTITESRSTKRKQTTDPQCFGPSVGSRLTD